MDLDRIKRCVIEITDNLNKIKCIEDHKMLIDCTTYSIEENLKIIVDESTKLTRSKTYFETLKFNCEKFSDCKFCPLDKYNEDFTKKCRADKFEIFNKYSPDELIEAYNFCKKYWEDMFND